MRVFTAVPLPKEAKKLAGDLFKRTLPVHYVNTENLHITLNFFGELETDQAANLRDLFVEVLRGKKSFPVEFDRIAKFRNQIHMTLKPNLALEGLQNQLEKEFSNAGYKFDHREFYSHVKIANMHMDKVMNMNRKIENFPNEILSGLDFIADRIVLYESKLLLHHAHHYPLVKINLR